MSAWQRYWFAPTSYLDLAMLRLIAVATQLFWIIVFAGQLDVLEARAALPDDNWQPLIILKLLNLPWGLALHAPQVARPVTMSR
jgi:hypothetical protein